MLLARIKPFFEPARLAARRLLAFGTKVAAVLFLISLESGL